MATNPHNGTGKTAYILYAHGARDSDWAAPIHAIKQQLQSLRSDVWVQAAFLEHMTPTLGEAVAEAAAQGVEHVVVVPLFFGRGGHLKNDFPEALAQARAAHPMLGISATLAMGEDPSMVAAIAAWIANASPTVISS